MTDKTPEALERAAMLERFGGDWNQATAEFLRRQQQRIEELEKALRIAWAGFINLSADMESGPLKRQMRKHESAIAEALLSTTQQEDSQA